MYCATCGTPLTAGLSYCKRCGTNLNKERPADQEKSLAGVLITAVVLIGVLGLSLAVGGAIALKVAAELHEAGVILYMLLSFVTIGAVEFMLMRQLARVLGRSREQKQLAEPAQPIFQPALIPANEARLAPLRTVPEPVTSVTENTTRTLEHSFRQS